VLYECNGQSTSDLFPKFAVLMTNVSGMVVSIFAYVTKDTGLKADAGFRKFYGRPFRVSRSLVLYAIKITHDHLFQHYPDLIFRIISPFSVTDLYL
jgi:hypothetical protein